ncbi:MAG: HlyD family efflux transporter periplasmic adaptor subunit [Phycisphaerae bacterium]|nr:HlyD family efflux transporter periplasmic adaptor subunit [Phycisphaerae bacterium]
MHSSMYDRKRSTTLTLRRFLAAVTISALPLGTLVGCGEEQAGAQKSTEMFTVERATFDMAIPVTGELAALKQIEVRNRLESRAVITEIVAEGRSISKGDVLLRLAEEEIRDKIKDAKDKVKTAESELIAAQQTLTIKENEKDSELEKADLAIELAKLALLAWENGEVVSKRQTLQLAMETADINLKRLEDRFNESAKLVEKKFISKDEYEKDRIAMIEARVKSQQAKLDLEVYESYQYKQDEAKKKSDLDQAQAERSRVEQKHDAELVKARSDVESTKFKVDSAKDRLTSLETQLSYCTVIAPSDGLVVYATSIDSGGGGRGGGDAQAPQVGTELKPNELVIILPDTSQMVANLKVSEALSGRIRPDQPVTVYSDALPNVPVTGQVQSVSVLAASGGWRDPNRRDYTVRVALNADPSLGLKPSMRCKAEILLDRVDDAMSVPIQAVFRQGPIAYVYVESGTGFAQRAVQVGRASELRVEVLSGLEIGDRVLMRNPLPEEVVAKLDFEKLEQSAPREDGAGRGDRAARGGDGAPSAGGANGDRPRGNRRRPTESADGAKAPNGAETSSSQPAGEATTAAGGAGHGSGAAPGVGNATGGDAATTPAKK